MPSLDHILDLLERHRQRATYGAVGAVVGVRAQFVMNGRPRDPRHSWVVNRLDGQPTGYTEEQKHPALTTRAAVISSGEELEAWLQAPR